MKTEEAILLLEHTGYDDFNLLEHQIKGRLEAIQVILKENQNYKEVIDKAIKYIETHKRKDEFLELNEWGTRDLLDILKKVE